MIVAVSATIAAIGFVAYFFEGVGKFLTIILSWDLSLHITELVLFSSEKSYALIIIFLTTIYTVKEII